MQHTRVMKFIRSNFAFGLFLLILFSFRWSLADQYVVPSGSMEPTIQVGDRILVNKMAYQMRLPFTDWVLAQAESPVRGDIVVFESPREDRATMVKRLIALPGDRVSIDNGFIEINGVPLANESEVQNAIASSANSDRVYYHETHNGTKSVAVQRMPELVRPHYAEFVVPDGMYFVMGDNRDNSADSREWGFLPHENLLGRAFAVGWSLRWNGLSLDVQLERFGLALN
ncbi:MAG: signal peptidase I [Bdellovibrionaceae bacterium]|nr:signal peptidase I [Pseudobdellovibrionaceae bacterium]